MQSRPKNIQVLMPDNRILDVCYYFNDSKIPDHEKEEITKLFIQLDNCVFTMKIEKSICRNHCAVEQLVHKKVINEKGHLC